MRIFISIILFFLTSNVIAADTARIPYFTNQKVAVWQTVIYPSKEKVLPMHNHTHDRVVVALTDGVLKVVNDKGVSHLITLKKDNAYFLKKDPANEKHSDENIGSNPIKVIVVDLQDSA